MRDLHDFRHMAASAPVGYDRPVIGEQRTGEVFQIGGLIAWAMVGVETFLQFAHSIERDLLPQVAAVVPPGEAPRAMAFSVVVVWTVALVLYAGFGVAFRATTASVACTVRARQVALLALQVVLALAVSTDLLFLVAAEIPFVLPGRWAFAWFAGQGALTAVAAFLSDPIELIPGAEGLSRPLAVGVTVLSSLAWQGLAFAAGTLAVVEMRRRRELSRVNAELVATQQVLAQSARAAERARIARELHDSLGHHLAALSVNLELASRVAEGSAAPPISAARESAQTLLGEVRSVVNATRAESEVELRQALVVLASGVDRPRVHLELPSGALALAPPAAHALFRAAQEAITNAVRHAAAGNLWLEVRYEDGGVALAARDDGRGAAVVTAGNGLQGMRERVEALGGRLTVETGLGQGFSLLAWIPGGETSR
jgi:signal transduction histidine kinase